MYKIISCLKRTDLPFNIQKTFITKPNKVFVIEPQVMRIIVGIANNNLPGDDELDGLESDGITREHILSAPSLLWMMLNKHNNKSLQESDGKDKIIYAPEGSITCKYLDKESGDKKYSIKIEGSWEHQNKLICDGRLIYDDYQKGFSLQVGFKNNKLQGEGACWWRKNLGDICDLKASVRRFKGNWINSFPEGNGTLSFEDEICLIADWYKGFPIGNVEYRNSEDEIIATGTIDYMHNASITFVDAQGDTSDYKGKVANNGALYGYGVLEYSNGDVFKGLIKSGKPFEGDVCYVDSTKAPEKIESGKKVVSVTKKNGFR
ncbi:hypothetical protein ACFLZV_01640 [Candidatus Margulisiibacteriota bacterium]